MERKLILFGAGNNGYKALKKYGEDKVAFFCDNALKKIGTEICGIEVISFIKMISLNRDDYLVMVTPGDVHIRWMLIGQLENEGIYDYAVFMEYPNRSHTFGIVPEKDCCANDDYLKTEAEKFKNVDLLESVDLLIESYEKIKIRKDMRYYFSSRNFESFNYGNVNSIAEYGRVELSDEYWPIVSHHDCMPSYVATTYDSAVIMSGAYHAKKIHQRYPYVPVFTVGPYIHYAKSVYLPNELLEKKSKIGRMLLAYMPHSIETTTRPYNRRLFIDRIIELYSDKFDTIWLCVYWTDILDDIVDYAESKGIHIVSCGYRFDERFNSRQKAMLELCDAVVCGDVGTFISYALYMNKPIARIDVPDIKSNWFEEFSDELERTIFLPKETEKYESEFLRTFDSSFDNNEQGKAWMDEVAGFSRIRSSKYINDIFEISKEIWLECDGNMKLYPNAVRNVYYKFLNVGDVDKIKIMVESVGARME